MHDPEPEARRRRGASRPSQHTLRLSPSPCGESFFSCAWGAREEGRGGEGERVKTDARPRNVSGEPGSSTVSGGCNRRGAFGPPFSSRSSGIGDGLRESASRGPSAASGGPSGHPVHSRAASDVASRSKGMRLLPFPLAALFPASRLLPLNAGTGIPCS